MSNGAPHRDSIFGGVLLLAVGVLFLVNRFDSQFHLGHLIRRYWPLLIILWGVAKLIDHFLVHSDGQRGPLLTGSEAAIFVFVIILLFAAGLHDWLRARFPDVAVHIEPFSHRYSQSQALSPLAIPAGAHVTVHTGRGSITVHTIDSGPLTVSATMSASGSSESGANDAMKSVPVVIDKSGDSYTVHPENQENSDDDISADLDVETPKNVTLEVNSDRGDISIAGVSGSVTAASQKGDLDIHNIKGDLNADVESGNVQISGVTGDVHLKGRGDEIDIGDVNGNASLDGDFFGPVHLRNISKITHYVTPRENFTIAQLTGRLEVGSDSVQLTDVAGPVTLTTHNKDVDAENIAGRMTIVDTHASVTIRYSDPPTQDFTVTNESGDVDLTVPSESTFDIAAISRDGDVDCEFTGSLKQSNVKGTGQLVGKVGNAGPKIAITTSYGTISIHKS